MWQSIRHYAGPYLQDLPALMPYILVGIGLLVLLILARVLVLLWARKRVSAPGDGGTGDDEGDDDGSQRAVSGIRTAFAEAMRRLRRLMHRRGFHVNWFVRLTGHRYRYEVPWYALIGEEGSGKTTLMRTLDLEAPVAPVITQDGRETEGTGCNWWYFNKALLVDVAGRFVHRPSGRQTQEQGWSKTLRQLRKHRPRQPLNGVVLTIDCTDLVGASKLKPADIEAKAARIHAKLQDMQQQLGLRLPVYVVLTKSDAIPGFSAFCEELPPERRQEMLGWSNPHAVDAAYSSEWIDECFATLEEDLHYAQIRALGDNLKEGDRAVFQTDDVDDFFFFPDQVQSLKESLQLYLDEIFQQSAYQSAHFFRGIYLTGDPEAEAPATTGAAQTAASDGSAQGGDRRRPVFTKELFSQKIFPEWKLVRPVASAVSWQQWATQAVQIAVAVLVFLGVFGLWYAGDELQERRSSILPSLREARASIQEVREWRTRVASDGGPAQRDLGAQLAFESVNSSLIRNMKQTSQIDLTFLLIPASWFSDLEETLDQSISSRYGKVILRSMRYGLQLRGESLSQQGLRSPPARQLGTDSLSVQSMPSYRAWQSYTEDISTFEATVQGYNRLPRTRDLAAFARIAEYLFEESILEDLQADEDAYQRAIEQADPEPLRLGSYQDPVSQRMLQYAQRFNTRLPRNYGVLTELRALARQLDNLNTLPTRIAQKRDALRAVRSIDRSMEELQAALSSEQAAWIRSDSLALTTVYGSFLAHADTSSLLQGDVEQRIEEGGRAAVAELRDRLFSVETQLGPLLTRTEGSGGIGWQSDVNELRTAFGTLLDQPYMRSPDVQTPFQDQIPAGRRMVWRPAVMKQVVNQVVEKYDSLVTQGLSTHPPAVQSAARSVAAAGMSENLMKYVSQAQSFELRPRSSPPRETEVRRRVNRFRETLDPLRQVLAVQRQLGMSAARNQIVQTTGEHAYGLLQDVDALLRRNELYTVTPTAFEQWSGQRPANLALTNARDSGDVQRYLDAQRRRITVLATDFAQPLLSFLTQWRGQLDGSYRELIEKWSNIQTQVRKYENQTPGNTLAVFEDFLMNGIEDVQPVPYYLNTAESVVNRGSSDFFLQKRNAVRRQLYERSRELSLQQATRNYEQLVTTFREQLQGRFPFASLSQEEVVQDASPDAIRTLYRQFDAYVATYRPVLERVGAPDDALRFLHQLEGVRPFFAPFLDDTVNYPVPTIDVAPSFYVNRAHSRAANQVLGWHLSIGPSTASGLDTADSLSWSSGDAVTVRLRWAADAPDQPVASQRGTARPERRTVSYRYTGQWALLRLLRAHAGQPSDFDRRFDPDPHTLRFTAQLENAETGAARQALLFLRLRLYQPGEADRVILDEPFPVRAPDLQSPLTTPSSPPQGETTGDA